MANHVDMRCSPPSPKVNVGGQCLRDLRDLRDRPLAPIKGEGELSSRFADFEAPPSFWDTSPVRRGTEGALGVGVGGKNAQIH